MFVLNFSCSMVKLLATASNQFIACLLATYIVQHRCIIIPKCTQVLSTNVQRAKSTMLREDQRGPMYIHLI
jgi:hypothetical protein